jgi:hypothetical protein
MAERYVLDALEVTLIATFVPGAVLPIAASVKPDGIDPERKIIVEVFSRIGKLKPAQAHKVRADLFKLAYLRKLLGPEWRTIFCFVDQSASASLLGRSWTAEAAQAFGVEILVQDLPENVRLQVIAAQDRQNMVRVR